MGSAADEPIPPSQTGELAQRYPSHAIKLTEREEGQADVMRPAERDTTLNDQQQAGSQTSRRRLLGRAAKAAAVTVAVGALLAKEGSSTAHADGTESQTTFVTSSSAIPPVTALNPATGGVAILGDATTGSGTGAGTGVQGKSDTGIGVQGDSASGTAVQAISSNGTSVNAICGNGTAVNAVTDSGDALFALSVSGGSGVNAKALDEVDGFEAITGVTTGQHKFAIFGQNEQNVASDGGGVWGDATNADGFSTNTGVKGTCDRGIGVLGMLGDHVADPFGGIAVKGTSKLSSGTGVVAENTAGGVALQVSGGSVQVKSPAMGMTTMSGSSMQVSNPVVTANSLIFLTLLDNPGLAVTFWISNRTSSTPSTPGSFTINASKPVMGVVTLQFLIIN